jgi:hypothetical protein
MEELKSVATSSFYCYDNKFKVVFASDGKALASRVLPGLLLFDCLMFLSCLSLNPEDGGNVSLKRRLIFNYCTATTTTATTTLHRAGPKTGTSSVYWAQLNRYHLKTETECSLRNVVFYLRDDG